MNLNYNKQLIKKGSNSNSNNQNNSNNMYNSSSQMSNYIVNNQNGFKQSYCIPKGQRINSFTESSHLSVQSERSNDLTNMTSLG
jgi:hypothetical protein